MFFGPRVESVCIAELAERLEKGPAVLLDVREPSEFASGRIPGAVNVPLGRLGEGLSRLDPTAETYVICAHGNRSVTATRALMRAGFTSVYNVKGGTAAWTGRLER